MKQDDLYRDLKNALKNQELLLYYQPEYSLSNSSFEGVEALLRWKHPKHGFVLPGEFIPLAEELNIMCDIDRWVLQTAVKQNKDWQDKGLAAMRVAVNVTQQQFDTPDFADFVLKTLQQIGLSPQYLEIELNENIIISESDFKILATLNRLSRAGVQIALDDFGTGHSTVSYLQMLPINRIKIDKSYIENINTDPRDANFVKAIIELAADLNLQVLVEGVESLKQLQALIHIKGVDTQGFYFSEPLPAEEVEKFLRNYLGKA